MAAVAHNPAFAKKVGISPKVGRDFIDADKGRKFKLGGNVENPKMSKKVAGFFAKQGNKKLAAHERREAAGKEEDTKSIAKQEERALKNAPADMKNYEKKEHKAMGFKKGGKVRPKKEKKSFSAMKARAMMAPPAPPPAAAPTAADMGAMMSGAPMSAAPPMGGGPMGGIPGMKKGGMARMSQRGDGIARKGRTGAEKVKMARGGGIESKGKTRGRFC
jgi:hypothetical protein